MSTEPRTITCKTCNSDFEHIQKGRGRPPVYCPDCRAERAKPIKQPEIEVKAEPKVTYEGTPAVGDRAIRPAFHMFESEGAALRNATRVTVKQIDEENDLAYVTHPSEKYPIPTKLSKLLRVNVVAA